MEWRWNGKKRKIKWKLNLMEWNRNGMKMEWKINDRKSWREIKQKWNGNRREKNEKSSGSKI